MKLNRSLAAVAASALFAAAVPQAATAGVLYFDFNRNSLGSNAQPSLFLFGNANQTATVTNLAGFNQTVTLDAQGFFDMPVPLSAAQSGTGIRNTGFQVESSTAIAGYFINRSRFTSDMTYLLDGAALGTDYYVASYANGLSEGSQVAIQATVNNTNVTFTPKSGAPITVTLNAGETYKYAGGSVDLTGSRVVSDKAVAVFSGNECVNVGGVTACDTLLEQAIPVRNLSKSYLVTASLGAERSSTQSDEVRVIATANNTEVRVDGVLVATLAAGSFHTFSLAAGAGAAITTSEPALVAQYLKGQGSGSGTDPALSYVPGVDTWLDEYRLATPDGSASFNFNYSSLVVETASLGSLMLDGALVDTTGFTGIAGTTYSRGIIDPGFGLFDLVADSPFLVMLGGGALTDSFFTYGGSTFAPGVSPPPPVTPPVTPPSGVPEPMTWGLVAVALAAMGVTQRRRRPTA